MNLQEIIQSNAFQESLKSKQSFLKFIYENFFGEPVNYETIDKIKILLDIYNSKNAKEKVKENDLLLS